MRFLDTAPIEGMTKKTQEGFLVAKANVVRTGVQTYLGKEVGLKDRQTVALYRPEEEVKAVKSVHSFSHAPITVGHPKAKMVDAQNWKELAVGEVSTEAVWNDGKIELPLILKDAKAIEMVESGVRELSAGYTSDIDWTPGKTPEGVLYDGIQRNIQINHVALVPKGRAGSECSIALGDADSWGENPVNMVEETHMKNVMLDGASFEVPEQVAAALEKAATELNDAKAKILTDAQIDERVEKRTAVKGAAKLIMGDEYQPTGSNEEIRAAVVKAKLGDSAVNGRSADYIEGRFDYLADEAAKKPVKDDPIRLGLKDAKPADAAGDWSKITAKFGGK